MVAPHRKKADLPLLLALACGASIEAAARQCGLTDRTIYRRLKDPEFRGQIAEVRRDMVKRAAGAMAAAAMESVKTLLDLQKPHNPGPVRLGATRAILEIGIKLREVTDIEEELAQIREMLTTSPGHEAVFRVGPSKLLEAASGDEDPDLSEGACDGPGQPAPDVA